MKTIQFDEVFDYVGDFGIYQFLVVFVMSIVSMQSALQGVGINVFAAKMDHWCSVQRLENFTHAQQKYIAIPYEKNRYSQCRKFDFNYTGYSDEYFFKWNRSVANLTES